MVVRESPTMCVATPMAAGIGIHHASQSSVVAPYPHAADKRMFAPPCTFAPADRSIPTAKATVNACP